MEPLVVTGQGAIILAREVRMEIQVLKDGTSQVCSVDALPDALRNPESLVWVDIITCDAQALALLREVFGFHPVAIRDCQERKGMPKFYPYSASCTEGAEVQRVAAAKHLPASTLVRTWILERPNREGSA